MKQIILSLIILMILTTLLYAQEQAADLETTVNDSFSESAINDTQSNDSFLSEKQFLQYDEPQAMPKVDMSKIIMQTVGSLLIVIVLVYLTVFLIKIMLSKKQQVFSKEKLLNVLERNYLEPKKAIFVVRAIDRLLVLGVTDNGINVLSEVTDPAVFSKVVSGDFYGYMKKYSSVEDKKEA